MADKNSNALEILSTMLNICKQRDSRSCLKVCALVSPCFRKVFSAIVPDNRKFTTHSYRPMKSHKLRRANRRDAIGASHTREICTGKKNIDLGSACLLTTQPVIIRQRAFTRAFMGALTFLMRSANWLPRHDG